MTFGGGLLLFGAVLLLGQVAPAPSWDELLRGLVNSLVPMLFGALVHWIGARHGQKAAQDAAAPPAASQTP